MIHLILSLDYELFGNGAGDTKKIKIEPTSRLLSICNKHGAKLTIMCEVAEYWAFKKAEEEGLLSHLSYSPSRLIEEQLRYAISHGHDVQLHLHPQWIGAKYTNGLWHLNMEQYRIADLPHGLGDIDDEFSILGALKKGKDTLENLLKPIKHDYTCSSFRAGGYYVQPEKEVIAAMKQLGILLDSSVVKGLKIDSPWKLDYTDAYKNYGYWWSKEDSLTEQGNAGEGILELPVFSEMKPYFLNFLPQKLMATLKRRKIEKSDPHRSINRKASTPSSSTVLQKLFSPHPHNLDFCKLSAGEMYRTVLNIVNNNKNSDIVPIVLIGHNKDFWNDRQLSRFLHKIAKHPDVRFSTFSNIQKEILNK
ncbi:hypothetical protein [Chitinivibrio alkaliphilus]|uniref:Polysaccharide deacetylase n=1 Tax=Chitinivibrio alkaliphilus ACht1 TaxID=1313304 RepID=U7D8J6_9BACT|nr:hypothetical protein [Chitinivibrio alkaliphilus]ERP31407.1 hypothetical protein CALK_1757 [Chitinivibrio alkaliphilus ACht1]